MMRSAAARFRAPPVLYAGVLIVFAALQVSAQASEAYRPYPCGTNQGNGCVVAPTFNDDGTEKKGQVNVLSYGSNGSYQDIFFSGLDKIYCKPHGGQHVESYTCKIQPVDLPKVTEWITCTPAADGNCNPAMSPQQYRIARYGSGSRWIYQFVSGSFQCPAGSANSFSGIKIDPMSGDNAIQKTNVSCGWSKEQFPAIPGRRWTTCAASSGVDCRFPSPGDYLVRLNHAVGSGDPVSETYRTVTGSNITCDYLKLGGPLGAGSHKRSCEYLPLPTFVSVKGDWNLVGLCSNCDNVNFKVTSGVEKGSSKEAESAFTWQLGASMSASAGSPLTMEATVDISANYTSDSRNIVSNSFTQNQSTSFAIECGAGALYQWVTGVEEVCMPGNAGNCVSVARSNLFRCLPSDMPAGKPPVQFDLATPAAAEPAAETTASGNATPNTTTSGSATPSTTTSGTATPGTPPAPTTTATVVTPSVNFRTACSDKWTTKLRGKTTASEFEVKPLLTADGQLKLESSLAATPPPYIVTKESYMNICVKHGGPALR